MLAGVPAAVDGVSPAGDNGFTRLSVELAPGPPLEDTLAVAEAVRKRLATMPDVGSANTAVGTQGRGSGFAEAARRVRAPRLAADSRSTTRRDSWSATGLRAQATAMLREVPGARIQFDGSDADRLVSRFRATTCAARIRSGQRRTGDAAAAGARHASRAAARLQKPEIVIRPDPERAADLGVTTETLGLVTASPPRRRRHRASKFNLDNRQIRFALRRPMRRASDLERIKLLAVPGKSRPRAPVNVADVTLGAAAVQLRASIEAATSA